VAHKRFPVQSLVAYTVSVFEKYKMTPTSNVYHRFSPFGYEIRSDLLSDTGFGYAVSYSLGPLHCQKSSVDKMDNTEAHIPLQI